MDRVSRLVGQIGEGGGLLVGLAIGLVEGSAQYVVTAHQFGQGSPQGHLIQ